MPARYDESEYVFCDLQAIYRYIRADDEPCARRFLEAAYDTFEFLADNPMIGRSRPEFGQFVADSRLSQSSHLLPPSRRPRADLARSAWLTRFASARPVSPAQFLHSLRRSYSTL
ncbi:MAG: type II toxin-antitoxin system RelE/ParE family toxin [Verrucomicrobiaceae bacterium]|nr:type II toxin-antitoxin system RelE/ParE family toxin [Verrucomicrobiaceae bacterium]